MVGNVIGSYKVLEMIGEGGMGAVFKGVDLMLEREVAIKVLRPELARQPDLVERFRSEAVMLAKLNHANIAMLYSFIRQGDDFFMVMEFVPGETIENIIKKRGAIPHAEAIRLFCQMLEGISRAHKMGIIHRDIKPANVMLTPEGEIKVMDFGIAKVLNSAKRLTKAGRMVGTVEYMSPEQVRGEPLGATSDIYSLGILFYEMLTGRVPFSSTSEFAVMQAHIAADPLPPREIVPNIPPQIERALLQALAKQPEDRFVSAEAFRAALLESAITPQTFVSPTSPLPVPPHIQPQHVSTEAGLRAKWQEQPFATQPLPVQPPPLIKETRVTPIDTAPATAPAGQHLKETRFAQVNAAYQRPPGGDVFDESNWRGVQSPSPVASIFSRLNWKHYAIAGAAGFIFMLAVALHLMMGQKGRTSPEQAITPRVEPTQAATQPTEYGNAPVKPEAAPGGEQLKPASLESKGQEQDKTPAEPGRASPKPKVRNNDKDGKKKPPKLPDINQ